MSGLEVWLDEHETGWLKPAGDEGGGAGSRLSLAYLERWTSEVLAFPLAPSVPMPPRGGPGSESDDIAVTRFFDHLLPEGEVRRRTFEALGLAPSDVFGALRAMGRDTAGALRLIEADHGRPAGPVQRGVSHDELSERLRHRDALPFAVWDGQVRGVLGGARDKLALYVETDGGWHLADGPQIASTHVLKPAPSEALGDLPFNEYFCMCLAARSGLDVARVQLHRVPEPVLLVERFDRQRLDDGRVRRLHAIDACQALGVPVAARDAVTHAQLFGLLKHSPSPLIDGRALLRWTMFQQLIGHGAANAKDVSFFVDHGGLRLAPAYGLRSDPASEPSFSAGDWALLARDADIAPRSLAQELKRMCETVRAQAEMLANDLSGEVPRQVIDAVLDRTMAECDRQAATV